MSSGIPIAGGRGGRESRVSSTGTGPIGAQSDAPGARGGAGRAPVPAGRFDASGRERPRAQTRVILVGRTGLDAKLRADPTLELVRVRSSLEAVGELADPIDEFSPSRAVVVVAAEADPVRSGGGGDGLAPTSEFVAALRRVDPGVRVIRLAAPGEAAVAGGYDAVITGEAGVEEIRSATGAPTPRSGGGPVASPSLSVAAPAPGSRSETGSIAARVDTTVNRAGAGEVDALVDSMLVSEAGEVSREVGDEQLVQQMLSGREIVGVALGVIRARLGRDEVQFFAAGSSRVLEEGVGGADVAWRGRVLGTLTCPSATGEELGAHAGWFAGWIVLSEQQSQLREAAFKDPLTGAWNRRYFERFLTTALEEARRLRRSVTVLMFDIDDFKRYNDTHGHGAGDEILAETVRLLRSVTRPADKVCRIGGDEFAVVFYEPDGPRDPASRHPESVFEIAQRFQRQICERRFPKLGPDAPGTLTISGGLATFPWDGSDPASLLARADELAMHSKRQGKNAITLGPGALRAHSRPPSSAPE